MLYKKCLGSIIRMLNLPVECSCISNKFQTTELQTIVKLMYVTSAANYCRKSSQYEPALQSRIERECHNNQGGWKKCKAE